MRVVGPRWRGIVTDLVAIVGDRGRLRDVVQYTLREARDAAQEGPVSARFLVPVGAGEDALPRPAAEALVERIRDGLAGESLGRLTVDVAPLPVAGADATARVTALVAALPPATTRVVLSPELDEFTPGVVGDAIASLGRDIAVERAPTGRSVRRPPIAFPWTPRRTATTFGLALAFYLALGDPTDPFDLVTGVVSAAVVAAVLSRVTLETDPTVATVGRMLRAVVFLPYLLYAVVRANLAMAYVVLHPGLPIEPSVVRLPAPEGRVTRALLANSITLTPGTLTVDITDDELVVHALTAGSRADLEAGSLARAVEFVMGEPGPRPDGGGR
jgi:multicomponent Na+:H+ antiporter subunit E